MTQLKDDKQINKINWNNVLKKKTIFNFYDWYQGMSHDSMKRKNNYTLYISDINSNV